ncbi:hypothetical protein E4T43_04538 [Aureobasidium subglaciale]|nr:hypothetical protein E4T43_04538 [Aureobasidium subglaciale]
MNDTSGTETQNSSAILPLPKEVIAQIKSSTTITTLNAVILGLFENSLDAQATKIDVSVDFHRGGCTIEDNGIGIVPSEFRGDGGLSRMYHTSKHTAQLDTHGGQGLFLASLGALSLLTVTSRHHEIRNAAGHGTHVSVRDLFGNMPVRVKQRALNVEDDSTSETEWQALKVDLVGLLLPWHRRVTVKVTDAGNPSRSLFINTASHFTPNALSERNLNTLNRRTTGFDQSTVSSILSQSGIISTGSKFSWIPVSASTRSVTVKGLISLEPAPSRISQFISIGIIPCLDENRHNGLYETVNRIFKQSSFGQIEDEAEPDETELGRRQNDRRYKRDGLTNKQLQGGRKGVDRWPRFYFRIDLNADEGVQSVSKLSDLRLKGITNVLESLTIHWLEANNFRPKKQRQRKQARDGNNQILAEHQHSPQPPRTKSRSPSASFGPSTGIVRSASQSDVSSKDSRASKRARSGLAVDTATQTMPFTDWSRIKSARPQMYEHIWKGKTPQNRPAVVEKSTIDDTVCIYPTPSPLEVDNHGTGQCGLDPESMNGTIAGQEYEHVGQTRLRDQDGEAYIDWLDPKTGQKYRINARTGVVMPEEARQPSSNPAPSGRTAAAADSRLSSFGKPLVLQRRGDKPKSTIDAPFNASSPSPWLEGFLQNWKNPTFAPQLEQPIATLGFSSLEQDTLHSHNYHSRCDVADAFSHAGAIDPSRLSKSALQHAQVISQVDDKFILLKLPSLAGSKSQELNHARQLLVLVDQHAASERYILETLLEELCTPALYNPVVKSNLGHTSTILTHPLDKPLHFQIPEQEEAMFETYAAHFAAWGILYDTTLHKADSPRLRILTLPPGISERCKASPNLLIELLRTEIHTLAENHTRTLPSTSTTTVTKHGWLKRIGSCPKGILQLINSRACRSAVMFNDELTREQCQELVDRVANTAFPFICAHGRNSMVPLVYLDGEGGEEGGLGGFGGGVEVENTGFGEKYREWRGKK